MHVSLSGWRLNILRYLLYFLLYPWIYIITCLLGILHAVETIYFKSLASDASTIIWIMTDVFCSTHCDCMSGFFSVHIIQGLSDHNVGSFLKSQLLEQTPFLLAACVTMRVHQQVNRQIFLFLESVFFVSLTQHVVIVLGNTQISYYFVKSKRFCHQ